MVNCSRRLSHELQLTFFSSQLVFLIFRQRNYKTPCRKQSNSLFTIIILKINYKYKFSLLAFYEIKVQMWLKTVSKLNPNQGWVRGGGCWYPLNNSETVKAVTLVFCNILLEMFVLKLVFLTRPNLQILGKTQTGVFPISGFLVNPYKMKLS